MMNATSVDCAVEVRRTEDIGCAYSRANIQSCIFSCRIPDDLLRERLDCQCEYRYDRCQGGYGALFSLALTLSRLATFVFVFLHAD